MNNMPTRVFDLLQSFSHMPENRVLFSSVSNGKWQDYTVADYRKFADETSFALLNFGIQKSEPVISITHNRAEFNFVDMGIMQTGAIHVPLYPAVDVQKLQAIVAETNARLIFISNKSVLRKLQQIKDSNLLTIVSFDTTAGAIAYSDFLQQSHKDYTLLEKIKSTVGTNDAASITYLSGGNTPLKGVVLSHKNQIFNLQQYLSFHHFDGCAQSISFLPLAHSFERAVNYSFQALGIKVIYCEGIASLPALLKQRNPDVMLAVPLVLERIVETTKNEIAKAKGAAGWLALRTLEIAKRTDVRYSQRIFCPRKMLFKIVFKGLRKFLGGNIKVMLCGGAALRPEVLNILWAAGIRTYEGYGLSEAGPLISYNHPKAFKAYTLGKLMPGVSAKVAADGEILVKSGGVMQHYFKTDSAETDTDGWLHTGDIGQIDGEGFLSLTGIKKTIFKLSSGLYTNPVPIESELLRFENIQNAWVYGHNRTQLTAILNTGKSNANAETESVKILSDNTSIGHDRENIISLQIADYNTKCEKYEQIATFEIVNDEWSIANGMLNADLSLNRIALLQKYRATIEKKYQG